METSTTRMNPLISVAAVSVIVLSAVGVAALTGMIPSSKGQTGDLQLPQEIVKPIAPAISHPVQKPAARKPAVRKTAPQPAEPAVYREYSEAPRVVEAPKPQPLPGQLGVVESVREVKEAGDAKGVGAVAGGVAGGVLGHKLGKGKGLWTLVGVAGGAVAGHQVERHVRAEKQWEVTVRLDDGSQRTFKHEAQPNWHAGDRVRLIDEKLVAA